MELRRLNSDEIAKINDLKRAIVDPKLKKMTYSVWSQTHQTCYQNSSTINDRFMICSLVLSHLHGLHTQNLFINDSIDFNLYFDDQDRIVNVSIPPEHIVTLENAKKLNQEQIEHHFLKIRELKQGSDEYMIISLIDNNVQYVLQKILITDARECPALMKFANEMRKINIPPMGVIIELSEYRNSLNVRSAKLNRDINSEMISLKNRIKEIKIKMFRDAYQNKQILQTTQENWIVVLDGNEYRLPHKRYLVGSSRKGMGALEDNGQIVWLSPDNNGIYTKRVDVYYQMNDIKSDHIEAWMSEEDANKIRSLRQGGGRRKHTDSRGVTRAVYVRNNREYIKVKNKKTNNFVYRRI